DEEWKFTTILFSCILLLVMGLLFAPRVNSTELTFMVISSFIVLGLGLILPMIEIDARMDEIKFTLLGETIRFEDQVLYFRSKSILEVTHLMLTQNSW